MAESSDNKNLFNCPICLHLLNNPVTTYCGHSFCMDCLNEFWDRDTLKGVYSCPQCRQTFTPRPALSKNTVIAEVVERMKIETPENATHVLRVAVSGDVECDICTETKLKAIKSCLVCLASYCESHIRTHYTSPALKRHKLVNASPHLLDQICPQHDKLLELYCCKDKQLICMQCALINHQNHKMTSPAAERQNIQLQGQLKAKLDRLNTEMHDREKKIQELRDAMNFHGLNSKAVVEQSEKMFTEQISSMMERKTKIANMIRCKEKAEVSKIEELIVTVEQEISDLRRRHEELGQLSEVEDDIYFIQKFSSLTAYVCTNLQKIAIRQHMTFKEIEMIICDLKSQLDDLCTQDVTRILEKVSAVYLMVNDEKITKYLPTYPRTREDFLTYSTRLNLNSSTACRDLSVKDKFVQRGDGWQDRCFRDAYFLPTYQVLCKESLSDRCYFEVQWTGSGCSIAFSYDQIKQGGPFAFGSDSRSWKCNFSTANNVLHSNQLTVFQLVSKIGVFLDQAAGTLSFYNVTDKMSLLHRIQNTFDKPLYPGFSFQEWENKSSVTICDLPKQKK